MSEFANYVDKPKIKVYPKSHENWRYFLYVPFKMESRETKKVLVILKNPSNARINLKEKIYESDPTVNNVTCYFYNHGFSGVIFVNLFARRDPNSENLNPYADNPEEIIGPYNDSCIRRLVTMLNPDKDIIVTAWGGYPHNARSLMKEVYRYRTEQIRAILYKQKVFYVGRMVKPRLLFPLHGLEWDSTKDRIIPCPLQFTLRP